MDISNIQLIIKDVVFRHTAYRELSGIYKNNDSYYLFMIYPFALSLYDVDYSQCFQLKLKINLLYHKHHQDFLEKEIDYDPCDIFDSIYRSHLENNNLTDEPNSTKKIHFQEECLNLNSDLKSMKRNDTLNKILN